MTKDKPIIIDGVDVSDCTNRGKHNACLAKCGIVCKIFPNCCFKQLSRKTQECEELKGRLEYIRQENKNLKDSATPEQIDVVSLKNYISTLEFAENRYRKALEEIEEYCNNQISLIGDLPFRTTESDILDIINKAKGQENG